MSPDNTKSPKGAVAPAARTEPDLAPETGTSPSLSILRKPSPTPSMKKKRLSISAIETVKPSRMSTKRLTAESKFFAPAGLTQRQIAIDLEAMGVEKTKVWQIARTKERPMDALGLPVPKKLLEPESDSAEENGRVFGIMASVRKRKRTSRAAAAAEGEVDGEEDYTPLILTPERSSNWVLLDPSRWAPDELAGLPYKTDYHYYKPGNAKILEYNLVSNSARIKSPPAVLKDRSVAYRATGPVIIDPNDPAAGDEEVKKPETRGRKKKAKTGPSKPSSAAFDNMPDDSTPSPSATGSPSFSGSSGKKSNITVRPRRPMFPNLTSADEPISTSTSAAVSDAAVAGSSGSKSRGSGRSARVIGDSDKDAEMEVAEGSDYDGETTQPEPTPTKEDLANFATRRSDRAGKGVKRYTR